MRNIKHSLNVIFNYKNHFIVQNEIGDIEVINESGDKFYIRLDDSKTTGRRKLIKMDFEEQLKSSIQYIDWVTSTKKTKN